MPHILEIEDCFIGGVALLLEIESLEGVDHLIDSRLDQNEGGSKFVPLFLYFLHQLQDHLNCAWDNFPVVCVGVVHKELGSVVLCPIDVFLVEDFEVGEPCANKFAHLLHGR
jgi:hypothetical protein